MNPEETPKKNGMRAIWIASAIFFILGLGFSIYWFAYKRYYPSTDDAYVNGNMILITPQVSGIVTSILADNTQFVEEGQPLVEIDRHDYEIAFEGARAELADTVRKVAQLFLRVEELQARLEEREADLLRAELDYDHRKALVEDRSVSLEDFEHSETTFLAMSAARVEAEKALLQAKVEVENTTLETHPKVMLAKSRFKRAFLDLHRCLVLAPSSGIITQRKAQVGEKVGATDPLMALVPLDQIWVDANYRELNLKYLRIGQKVTLFADMYGRSLTYDGRIVGLNPGTGSIFSVLPPQNATGNWIKIVQRVPVKISLDPEQIKAHPLVLGLTVTVKTNTHDRSGKQLPDESLIEPIYKTRVYEKELQGVEDLIEQIIAENGPRCGQN